MKQLTIRHRMAGHTIDPETEILLLGTFNPDTPGNAADFFYGRHRNYLWRLLPLAFGEPDLKGKSKADKAAFLKRHRIDFADLITAVCVAEDDATNYQDDFIDSKVAVWTDVVSEIRKLKKLRKVLLTRKTFSGIPNIRQHTEKVRQYCAANNIAFACLVTPARGYSEAKQKTWTTALQA